ncbi:hypothetical protein M885DRAFT_513273 [Pelagophyceae sp. CCMP2097]|nr:hypothetical protein M885DRAFT_513273 [Pelagophyceae sp. CCMP2097]
MAPRSVPQEPLRREVLGAIAGLTAAAAVPPGAYAAAAGGDVVEAAFPGAMGYNALTTKLLSVLRPRGYAKFTTLVGTSLCPDEVNAPLMESLKVAWPGKSFALGGLGGLPFSGKAGLSAYAHHAVDDGKLLIVFAPHVGISAGGTVGKIERSGQTEISSACGASVGAYKTLLADGSAGGGDLPSDDVQFDLILKSLAPRMKDIGRAADNNAIVKLTDNMYTIVRDSLLRQIAGTPSMFDGVTELAVIGGVQINRPGKGNDAFQPRLLQVFNRAGLIADLFSEIVDPVVATFPGAMPYETLTQQVVKTLLPRGYTKYTTLLGTSLCPDEVNAPLIESLRSVWPGRAFALGGLGGLPFSGKAGLSAYAHHATDNGKLLIVFAPHVGINSRGAFGKIEREGQAESSSACGASVGAYKTLLADEMAGRGDEMPSDDLQFDFILKSLAPRMRDIEKYKDNSAIVALTDNMYLIVRNTLLRQIQATPSMFDGVTELAVLGGVQINRSGRTVDTFHPRFFTVFNRAGPVADLLPQFLAASAARNLS